MSKTRLPPASMLEDSALLGVSSFQAALLQYGFHMCRVCSTQILPLVSVLSVSSHMKLLIQREGVQSEAQACQTKACSSTVLQSSSAVTPHCDPREPENS